jgi:RNA polymerase sigma-70 factor, ECF subfamily
MTRSEAREQSAGRWEPAIAAQPPTDLTDEELLGRLAQEDEEAMRMFYRRYAGLVFSLAQRMLGDTARAEEILQETMLRVWRMAGSYDATRGHADAWVVTIARNLTISTLRRERNAPVFASLDDLGDIEDIADDPEEAAWLRARREMVREALLQLPLAQRKVVLLAYFGDFSQSEIADRTGEPLGTVKSRLRLALRRLEPLLRAGAYDVLLALCCAGWLASVVR